LALVDAGIPVTEYMIACTASLANGDVPLVDISHLEEISGGPNLTVAALPLSGQVCETGDSNHAF
jgi:exosome complex component RRP41